MQPRLKITRYLTKLFLIDSIQYFYISPEYKTPVINFKNLFWPSNNNGMGMGYEGDKGDFDTTKVNKQLLSLKAL